MQPKWYSWIILFNVFFLLGFWRGTGAPVEAQQAKSHTQSNNSANKKSTEGLHLIADVLKNKNLGYELEYYSKGELAAFESQTKEYIQYKDNKLTTEQKARLLVQCLIQPEEHLYCSTISESWVEDRVGKTQRRAILTMDRIANQVARESLRENINEGNFEELERATTKEVRGALRGFRSWDELSKISKKAVSNSECYSVQFFYSLGRKLEEHFPESEARELTRSVYQRAHECGTVDNEKAVEARFRLSLLHIFEENCDAALGVLEKLIQDPEESFLSRGLYWQAHCAKETGNQMLYSVAKNRLLKANPLGFHTLALNSGRNNPVVNLLFRNPGYLRFRSLVKPHLNRRVVAVEYLLKHKKAKLARSALRPVIAELPEAEPAFQIYIAIIANRAGAILDQLRIVSRTLRQNPEIISQESLKLLFPMKRFKTLWKQRKRIDPYLIAALIRQESAFNERARSRAGALGLMQLMPATARQHQRVSRSALLRPNTNVKIGVRELSSLLRKYGGDGELSLAAYNAGPRNVDRWLDRYPTRNKMLFVDLIPFSETRSYVALIVRNYYWYLNLYAPDALHLNQGKKGSRKRNRKIAASEPAGSNLPMFTLLGAM